MKKQNRITGLLLILCLLLACCSGAAAEIKVTEYPIDSYANLNVVSNNIVIKGKDNLLRVFNSNGTEMLSDGYEMIYALDSLQGFFRVDNRESVNNSGLLDANGQLYIPLKYGKIEALSDRWQVGWVYEAATAENYDQRFSSYEPGYFLVASVDIFYRGELKATLNRMDYQEAQVFADYLRVRDRNGNYVFYNKDMQKSPRGGEYMKEFVEENGVVWHQGSGQQAFTAGCTLQPEEVELCIWSKNGELLDLQGNAVGYVQGYMPTNTFNRADLILAKDKSGKYCYIDASGKPVIPCVYDDLDNDVWEVAKMGYAYAVRDGKAGFVNIRTGEETGFEYSEKVCDQYAGYLAIKDLDGLYIVISAKAGKLPEKYAAFSSDKPYKYPSNPLAVVKDTQGRYGVINMDGETVVPMSADFRSSYDFETSFDGTAVYAKSSKKASLYIIETVEPDTSETEESAESTINVSGIQDMLQNILNNVPSFQDVFVPAEPIASVTEAPIPKAEPDPASDAWVCENGHEGNTGKFCSECGAPKPTPTPEPTPEPTPAPQDDTWVCENGHGGNTGKFCSECGAPKPVPQDDTWVCENGHGGNTGKFCSECGAPKPTGEKEPQQPAAVYDNPFPEQIARFNVPFTGTHTDHKYAIAEFLSHSTPQDAHYVAFEKSGVASGQLAWDRYAGNGYDMYVVYQNQGTQVYAYAYTFELDASKHVEWSDVPNPSTCVGAVIWVESGANNDVYQSLFDKAAESTDYPAVNYVLNVLDPAESANFFSLQLSVFREEANNGMSRYWVVFHNTQK